MDVDFIRLFDQCCWLAMDVYLGRITCDHVGIFLVAFGE